MLTREDEDDVLLDHLRSECKKRFGEIRPPPLAARGVEVELVHAFPDRGIEPLCAAFRVTTALPRVQTALLANRLRLTSAIEGLRIATLDADAEMFTNVNTPDDYERALTRP